MEVKNITELMNKMSLTSLTVGSRIWVNITHIDTPHDFYVVPTAYKDYLTVLENPEGASKALESDLYAGSVVLYESTRMGRCVRGEITETPKEENDGYTLRAIDYGFIETNVSSEQVYQKKINLEPLATKCMLADCFPLRGGTWSKSSIEAMKDYVGDERAFMEVTSKNRNKLIVDLRNTVVPEDIATVMVKTDYALLWNGDGAYTVNRLTSPAAKKIFITYKTYKPNDVIRVRVLSGDSLDNFYVAEVNEFKEYARGKGEFKLDMRRSKQITIDNFKVNTPIGGFFMKLNQDFERAVIKEIIVPESEAAVQLVDWGTVHRLSISNMFELKEYHCLKPARAIYCTADETQRWDNGLPKFLYPGYEFNITIVEPGHQLQKPNKVTLSRVKGF